MRPPEIIVHADWSVDPAKRWCALARRTPAGGYLAEPPRPVGPLADFFAALQAQAGGDGTVLAGFDFPLGLPEAYARAAGIENFIDALDLFGRDPWAEFYEPATQANEIALTRPFYPARPGGTRHCHQFEALGFASMDPLRRCCDYKTATRGAASPLFWTLGGQQVGKAAITGWRDLLAPARRDAMALQFWPFEGRLEDLLAGPGIVVAETYPGEIYSHLDLQIRHSTRSKRRRSDRAGDADCLLSWVTATGVEMAPDLVDEIDDGFGGAADGEDRFDSVVGLFGMLNIVRPTIPTIRCCAGSKGGFSVRRRRRQRIEPDLASA